MMPAQQPVFDPHEVAGELRSHLSKHVESVAPTLSTPATSPMFTREQNGALVDRAGRVVVPAPAVPK